MRSDWLLRVVTFSSRTAQPLNETLSTLRGRAPDLIHERSTFPTLTNMSYYQAVIENCNEFDFDIVKFLQMQSPKTPYQGKLGMSKNFSLDALRDTVIYNIYQQSLSLNPVTTRKLLSFLKQDFTDDTSKTFLQVLVHYSKIDLTHFEESKYISVANVFSREISSFLRNVEASSGVDEERVAVASGDLKELIKNALVSKPMISAFAATVKRVYETNTTRAQDLQQQISEMEIYEVKRFGPMPGLRGACMMNGILICTDEMARPVGSVRNHVDIITVAAHVTAHYLVSLMYDDFNFSSPYKYLSFPDSTENLHRMDPLLPDTPYVELLLFDGIQPLWAKSSHEAAAAFMNRLSTFSSYPIIPKIEHMSLEIIHRQFPSPSFGIDIEEHFSPLC